MSGWRKNEREMRAMVLAELAAAEAKVLQEFRNALGHSVIDYAHGERAQRIVFSGSGDWKARLRLRSIVRQQLRGTR